MRSKPAPNGLALHYITNKQLLRDGDLLLVVCAGRGVDALWVTVVVFGPGVSPVRMAASLSMLVARALLCLQWLCVWPAVTTSP